MVKFRGQIKVKRINGRKGVFSVGTLVTSIGEFAVKNSGLDQYEEGLYEGVFVVAHIEPASYVTGNGRIIVEIRALVTEMAITRAESKVIDAVPVEIDPLDEAQIVAPPPKAPPAPVVVPKAADKERMQPQQPTAEQTPVATQPKEADPDVELFGELWPLANVVKLDPTDRARLRAQADRLKQIGFRFNAGQQQWERKAAA